MVHGFFIRQRLFNQVYTINCKNKDDKDYNYIHISKFNIFKFLFNISNFLSYRMRYDTIRHGVIQQLIACLLLPPNSS